MNHSIEKPIRILFIEDSQNDAELILLQLKKDGLDVECKRVVTEAEFITSLAWTPDLILSDYILPQFSGSRALQLIKEKSLDIPFILVTGAADEETIINAFKQGADDYLMKDRLGRLGSAILQALEQKRLRDEKRRADEALRMSEERLELFFALSLAGFFFMMLDEPVRWDDTVDKEKTLNYIFAHQHITKVNDAVLAQFGGTSEQIIGLTPADLFAHDLEQGKTVWRKMFDTGHLVVVTDERRLDGTRMWMEGGYVCLYDTEGRITGHIGIRRDISSRKQTEEKLRQLSRAVEQSPASIIITDTRGNIQYVNPKFSQTTGYSAEEAIGRNPRILKSGHTSREEYKQMWDTIASGGEWRGEFRNRKKNGDLYWEAVSISPIFDDHGEITHFIGIKEEITIRKQVEENLRKTEMQYRTLAEQIPPIIYMAAIDQHMGVTYVSPRIEMLGFSQDEWIADPDLWLRQIHPDDQEHIKEIIKESRSSGKPFKAEYRIMARDGRELWFLDEAMDILDAGGNLQYRQGFMLDITERKQAEESLRRQNTYLGLLNEMTRAILPSVDYDSTLHILASYLKKMTDADDCYITRWDEARQQTTPVATTAILDAPYTQRDIIDSSQVDLTTSVLNAGHALAVNDVFNSPHISVDIAKRYPALSALGVPLIVGEHKLGAAIIAYNTPHHFTANEIERAEHAGNQIALALWEFQQGLEIQRRLKESNTLTEISRALSETERGGTDKVLQLIVDSARELIEHAEESVIHLLDADEEVLIPRAISGFDEGRSASKHSKIGLREGVAGLVITEGRTVNVGDITSDPIYIIKDNLPTYRSLLVAPVQRGGQRIGTISVQSSRLNAFAFDDEELLNSLSIQAAIAIENTRLFEATQQSLREINALYLTGQELASSLNTDELIANVVNILQKTFGYYHAQIFLLDAAGGDLVLKNGSGEVGAALVKMKHRLPAGMGIVGHVAETATPFATNNVNDVMFFFRNPLLPDTLSELAVPIKVDGKVLGVVDIQDKPPHRLTDNDIHLVVAVADQLSIALQKASLYENLQTSLQQEQAVRSQLIQSERLALVGRLLASVSHELNNPLQAIQNALFLLKGEEQLSPQGRQDLDVILSEAERMASLIERLRTAYRPGRVKDFRPVDINNLIEDVHTLIATFLRQKKIAFELHPEPDLPPVSGMSDQMRQVVLNLFLNAIDAMDPGGRLIIRTRHLVQQNEVLLSVKDTGPGITPDLLPKIFDAFITSKQTGTGLGLTITRDIIEQHFGRIEAENDPEGGAIFQVWLPVDGKGQS